MAATSPTVVLSSSKVWRIPHSVVCVLPRVQMRWPQFKLADWQRYMMLSTSALIFFMVTFVGYSGYQ